MIRAFIDTNVLLNVWFKEIDPRTSRPLWKASLRVLKLVEEGNIKGIVSIFTIMESVHVFRRKGADPKIAQSDIQDLGLEVYIPEIPALLDALTYQLELGGVDPYDAVALSSAVNSNCDVLIARDEEFKKRGGKGVIKIVSPEEFLSYLEERGLL